MPRPIKIKKPKSFMFTTKHHSFAGAMGCVVCVISIVVLVGSIYMAYIHRGTSSILMGSEAFFSIILNFIGIIAGTTALSERDIHKWVPIVSIAANAAVLAIWVLLVIWGRQ